MENVPVVPDRAVAEAVAKAIWDFEENRAAKAAWDHERSTYRPEPWDGVHNLDRAEYMLKAHAAIHAYETARSATDATPVPATRAAGKRSPDESPKKDRDRRLPTSDVPTPNSQAVGSGRPKPEAGTSGSSHDEGGKA